MFRWREKRHAEKKDIKRRDIMIKRSKGLHQNTQDDPGDSCNLTTQLFFITARQHLISYMTDKDIGAVTETELNQGQGHFSGVENK